MDVFNSALHSAFVGAFGEYLKGISRSGACRPSQMAPWPMPDNGLMTTSPSCWSCPTRSSAGPHSKSSRKPCRVPLKPCRGWG